MVPQVIDNVRNIGQDDVIQENGVLTVATQARRLTPEHIARLGPWLRLNQLDERRPWFIHSPCHSDATGLHAAQVISLCRQFCHTHSRASLLYEYCGVPYQFRTPLLQSLLYAAPGFQHSQGMKARGEALSARALASVLVDNDNAVLYLNDPLIRIRADEDATPVTYRYSTLRRRP
ncbi:hypothetical protein [Dickeya lacustris]|uniref:Uncharacterized protein n=1 Tax=Dickeya lacustris TaxID=2259638 RepID=A0ABY8G3G2_9GAMM|nr:hypothetical protein [Dickeya lacustris]WFN54485.1 hypothetical protein O1Q98_12410 [Dickeya lacustris]